MAKTVSDYEAEGAAAYSAGQLLPPGDPKSWQQKALAAGWIKARDAYLATLTITKRSVPPSVVEHLALLSAELPKSSMVRRGRIEAKIARLQVKWGLR